MKARGAFLIAVFFVARAFAANVDSWLVEPPSAISAAKKEKKIAVEFFEIVASMKANAEAELKKKPFIPVSPAQAQKFAGRAFTCPSGKRPYLVRAVYGFAGTGAFHVFAVDRALWVAHESLGPEMVSWRTALIVNLDFEPAAVYATVDIAE